MDGPRSAARALTDDAPGLTPGRSRTPNPRENPGVHHGCEAALGGSTVRRRQPAIPRSSPCRPSRSPSPTSVTPARRRRRSKPDRRRLARSRAGQLLVAAVCLSLSTFGVGAAAAAPPSNDHFAGALISGPDGTVQGNNTDATGQPGEPNIAGHTPDMSVWYSWVAPESGPTSFTCVCGVRHAARRLHRRQLSRAAVRRVQRRLQRHAAVQGDVQRHGQQDVPDRRRRLPRRSRRVRAAMAAELAGERQLRQPDSACGPNRKRSQRRHRPLDWRAGRALALGNPRQDRVVFVDSA